MCYETTARPPLPPIIGGAATGDLITLKASDGNEFAAFSAKAESAGGPGIVICPDVRGLHGFYEDLALRFAEAGVHATAFDYFGRTAGVAERDDNFDFMPEVMKTTPAGTAADVAASAAHVRSDAGGGATSAFTVGFCFGGRNSFNQAVAGHGLAGVIGFYGMVGESPMFGGPETAPVNLASKYECPVLGLFGGTDGIITQDSIDAFGKALDAANVANELKTYDGAPHSFFDRAFDQFKDACDDAWVRMLKFIKTNAG
jgi:carboxymethylenebutenolidase